VSGGGLDRRQVEYSPDPIPLTILQDHRWIESPRTCREEGRIGKGRDGKRKLRNG